MSGALTLPPLEVTVSTDIASCTVIPLVNCKDCRIINRSGGAVTLVHWEAEGIEAEFVQANDATDLVIADNESQQVDPVMFSTYYLKLVLASGSDVTVVAERKGDPGLA